MPSRKDRFPYLATATLVLLAHSVEAKGKSSSKVSKPVGNGGGGGSTCYDNNGNQITCPLSKTEVIVIGVIAGIVGIAFIACIICCVVRKRRQRLASKKKDTKHADQEAPSEEAAVPLCPNQADDPDEKQPNEIAESEKPHYTTPYDPVYPTQHYDHQFSDSASIASSVYNVPPVTHAQPQDYSNQYYYNTYPTAPPKMYAPPSHHPGSDA